MNVRPPEAADEDDQLVDARLRAALRHAPDGSAAPPEALRRAVLQAARASLPPKPTWWQRLFGSGPSMPRAWAAAAGIGAVGLALNLAWHASTEGPAEEYGPVASKSAATKPAPAAPAAMQESQVAPADTLSMPPEATPPPPKAARRDAAAAPALRQQALPEPTVVATAPAPAPMPAAAPPAPVAAPAPAAELANEARKKSLAKEERVMPEAAGQVSRYADKALADERKAPAAPAQITPTTSAAPATPSADSARNEGLSAAAKPAAPVPMESAARARSLAPAGVAAAAAPAAPSRWPEPLARMQAAFSQAEDWPNGWMQQGRAEIAVPRRAWWQAMLAGTAGRWQDVREPVPATLENNPTWHVSGEHGVRFKLTVAEGQAWLQSEGSVWRAPWSTLPGPLPR